MDMETRVKNIVGWALVDYPGIRLAVGPDQQQLEQGPATPYRSAYDLGPFSPVDVNRGR